VGKGGLLKILKFGFRDFVSTKCYDRDLREKTLVAGKGGGRKEKKRTTEKGEKVVSAGALNPIQAPVPRKKKKIVQKRQVGDHWQKKVAGKGQ